MSYELYKDYVLDTETGRQIPVDEMNADYRAIRRFIVDVPEKLLENKKKELISQSKQAATSMIYNLADVHKQLNSIAAALAILYPHVQSLFSPAELAEIQPALDLYANILKIRHAQNAVEDKINAVADIHDLDGFDPTAQEQAVIDAN